MRAVLIGASSTALATARVLLKHGHEVVLIERDKERAEAVARELDCGCLHGDGSRPALLKDADPGHTALLYCLTSDDKTNILASLVARTLGFERVVCKIQDPELVHLCVELGLEDVIVPAQTMGRRLAHMLEGRDPWEISAKIRGEAQLYSFVAGEDDAGPVAELALPKRTRVVCLYRDDAFRVPEDDERLEAGDELVLVTDAEGLDKLAQRWGPKPRHG